MSTNHTRTVESCFVNIERNDYSPSIRSKRWLLSSSSKLCLRIVFPFILIMFFGLQAVTLLGTATLAVQTVVLATSLGASMPKSGEPAQIPLHEADSETPPAAGDVRTTNLSTLTEPVVLDGKAFWVISGIRLILLPFSGMLFTFVSHSHALPSSCSRRCMIGSTK